MSHNSFPYNPIDENTAREARISAVFRYLGILTGFAIVSAAIVSFSGDERFDSFVGNFFESASLQYNDANLEPEFSFTLHRSGYEGLNFFDDDDNFMTYKMLEKYVAVIEPYSAMVIDIPSLDLSADYNIRFTACPYDSTTGVVSSMNCEFGELKKTKARPMVVKCAAHDEYSISVVQYSMSSGTLMVNSTGLAKCLYVRRDISALTDSDLSDTMDAMYTLWSTAELDGQELYGQNFHSSKWFAEGHMFNAAQRDADHIHEGQGFLAQHVKLTNLYELSVQAVNPAVTLPYWDYTYETGDLAQSIMFTPETFGSVSNPTEACCWTYANDSILDAAIPDGRWAYIKADLHNDKYTDLTNAFGYLRGPWNTNPSPYISRFTISHTSLPSCSAYYRWVQLTDQTEFFALAPFAPHASTHGAIGGVFGCDIFDPLMDEGLIKDDMSKRRICKKWSIILKELYRGNFISPSVNCTIENYDIDGNSCSYQCSESADSITAMESSLKNLITTNYVPTTMTQQGWAKWRDFVCSGSGHKVFSGDQLEAASPSDPSFWPIHPNLERLYHAKMMSGGFLTYDWPTDVNDICDKSKCYEEEYGTKGYYDQCCAGHYEDSQLLDFVSGDVLSGWSYTNKEILQMSNPNSADDYKLPYIYDDFTWNHCEEDFEDVYKSLAQGILTSASSSSRSSTAEEYTLSYWLEKDS